MKKTLALLLTLGLLAGLLTVPASAAPALSAYEACQALEDYALPRRDSNDVPRKGKFFVDFNQDGMPEMVAVYCEDDGTAWGWGSMTVYYLDNSGSVRAGDEFSLIVSGLNHTNTISVVRFTDGTYGLLDSGYARYGDPSDWDNMMRYQGNGKFSKTSAKGTIYCTLDSSDLDLPDQYGFFPKPAEPVAPPKPEVPASPLGDRLSAAKAEAIAQLDGVYYSGERAAMAMTRSQARAIQAQIAQYAAAAPAAGLSDVYVSLFDAGCGIPGVFMAKGFPGTMSSPTRLSGGEMLYETGECAIWTFQGGEALVPFPHLSAEDNVSLYPSCVERSTYAGDESHCETSYYALGYGFLFDNPGSTLVEDHDWDSGAHTCFVNGARVTDKQYQEFVTLWQGAGLRASAGPGGGVEYIIKYMTPANQATAALDRFVNAFTAYPATQSVEVDGKAVELQCYALRDGENNPTNYVKLRDLAMLLSGTDAQFDVGWDGTVAITTGKAYTPNGTELQTPFSGERTYADAAAATKVDGQSADLSAFVLTDDAGGGYTYYKLRDLGAALGFHVDWSAERGVFIKTN